MGKPNPAATPRRILLVDDHADSLLALQLFLEMSGHQVRQANRVEQAWQVAQEWTPEVVFLDLNLRGSFDGLALGEQLRRLLPQARLVALSGSMRQDIHERLVAARFDGFLSKPVDIHDLLPFC